MADRDPLLQEREKTHGSFQRNAEISQGIKNIYTHAGQDYTHIHPVFKESLDMIALKISRIVSGQHMFEDHWDDIAGYAKLSSEFAKQLKTACLKSP